MMWYHWRRRYRVMLVARYTRRIAYITRELEHIEVPFSQAESFLTYERQNLFFKRQELIKKNELHSHHTA